MTYSWPGNVRELQNAIERAAILANGPEINESALQLPAPKPSAEQLPGGMLDEEFLWEGSARGGVAAGRPARRAVQDSGCAARLQVEQDASRGKARSIVQNPAAQNPHLGPRELARLSQPSVSCHFRASHSAYGRRAVCRITLRTFQDLTRTCVKPTFSITAVSSGGVGNFSTEPGR